MKYNFLIITLVLICQLKTLGQIKPLKIGDTLPPIFIDNILNSYQTQTNTSDYRGKLLLLDFGATTCVPCIRAFPVLDSLQQEFKNKLQVFMVTREAKNKVLSFLQTNKTAKNHPLAVITEDSLLNAYFPHSALPHEVWINEDGIVTAITDHEYLTAQNIKQVINKVPVNWPVKSDTLSYQLGNDANNNFEAMPLYFSSFYKYQPGYRPSKSRLIDSSKKVYQIRMVNSNILKLYSTIFSLNDVNFFPKQIIADSVWQNHLYYKPEFGYKAAWEQENLYTYELTLPVTTTDKQRLEKIKNDLDLYLSIVTIFEKRYMDCSVLVRTNNLSTSTRKKNIKQTNLHTIINHYNQINEHPLIINETCYSEFELTKQYIDINRENIKNENVLMKALNKAGYTLKKTKRLVDILEFTEPKTK